MKFSSRLKLTVSILATLPALAAATTYPVTLTDVDGQKVTISKEPQRIILQDGRDILNLALLDREDPFKRLVSWNNLLKKQDSGSWNLLKKKWPEAEKVLDMGFSDHGDVDLETVISRQPDLMIAQLRAKPALQSTGVLDKLAALHVPVLFIDDELHAVQNTAASVTLLGKALSREENAKAYTDFYQQKLTALQNTVKDISPKPLVFIEPIAGRGDDCCFTHGRNGWGALVEATGARNIGSELLPGSSGNISLEKVISMKPDFYVMTGSRRGGNAPILPFGYDSNVGDIKATFDKLRDRAGVKDIPAVKAGKVAGIYHHFYNHPYNIVGMEVLAKDFYPQQFADTDPLADYHYIIRHFTQLPDDPINIEYHPG